MTRTLTWMPTPSSRVKLVLITAGFGMLLGGLAFLAYRNASLSELHKRLEHLRAEGVPFDDATLEACYLARSTTRNLDSWLEVLDSLASREFRESCEHIPYVGEAEEIPPSDLPWKEEQKTRKFLAEWATLRERLHELLEDAEPVRFPITFDASDTMLDRLDQLRFAMQLLSLECNVAIRDHDGAAAAVSIYRLTKCSDVVTIELGLVAACISLALDAVALEQLRFAISSGILSNEQLQSLRSNLIADRDIGDRWRKAMQGSRAVYLPYVLSPHSYVHTDLPPQIPSRLPLRTFIPRYRDALVFLDYMAKVEVLPTSELVSFSQSIRTLDRELASLANTNSWSSIAAETTLMMAESVKLGGDFFVRSALQHRIAALTAAVGIYQGSHGSFPQVLEDLQDVGVDVTELNYYGTAPFGYTFDEDEAFVWGFDPRLRIEATDFPPTSIENSGLKEQVSIWVWRIPKARP